MESDIILIQRNRNGISETDFEFPPAAGRRYLIFTRKRLGWLPSQEKVPFFGNIADRQKLKSIFLTSPHETVGLL